MPAAPEPAAPADAADSQATDPAATAANGGNRPVFVLAAGVASFVAGLAVYAIRRSAAGPTTPDVAPAAWRAIGAEYDPRRGW